MIRFAAIGLVGLLVVLVYWFSDTARAKNVSGIFDSLVNGNPSINQAAFEQRSLVAVNLRRSQLGLAQLSGDLEIHDAIGRFAATHSRLAEIQLDDLFINLQNQFPSAQFLSATVQLNPSDEGLTRNLAEWQDASDPQYNTLSTLAFRDGLRNGCVAVLSRRLPPFELDSANRDGGRFFHRCPHCESSHSILLDRQSRTLILSCPDCLRPYDIVAANSDGEFQHATNFLEGFRLPPAGEEPNTGISSKDQMIEIWNRILRHCEYEYDHKGLNVGEAWKLPSQTWRDASGDCEDTAILLADALLSEGIEARVAVGWNIHIGQHAWCVAKIGQDQWVLESTLQLKTGELPIPTSAEKAEKEYQPEQLFDRDRLYFRLSGQPKDGCPDYWTSEIWESLPAN